MPQACLHCGAQFSGSDRFCCQGCATVYSLLEDRKLQDYYTLRDRVKTRVPQTPAPLPTQGYTYLDDPEFTAEYATDGGRRMCFYLEGVHCAACVWLTEKLPEFVDGVEYLRLNLSTGVADVRLLPEGSFAKAAEEVARIGYLPHPVKNDENEFHRNRENRRHLIQLGVAAMASGNIMLLAIALYAGAEGGLAQVFRWTSFALYLPVIVYSAEPFYRSAWASLTSLISKKGRQLSIDVPIFLGLLIGTLASIVGLIRGSDDLYFDSLSSLVFLLLSTRYLLRKVNQRAFDSTRLMHFVVPSKAHREGDLIRVLSGECFPIDGVIEEGESTVNCALLTGESTPKAVVPGSQVHAGTWNLHSPLLVRVTASGTRTRLGQFLKAMESSLEKRAPIVAYLDRVGQVFVLASLILTVVGFFVGLSTSWHEAVQRALAVAIIVCPCTFALATPLAMSLAMSRCARQGILIQGADVIERISQVENIFFDKTGTVTFGNLDVVSWEETEPGTMLALLALETRSAHPIAKAIVERFLQELTANRQLPEVEKFKDRSGIGVSGRIHDSLYEAKALFQDSTDTNWVGTQIQVFRDGLPVGKVKLSDQIRPDSLAAVQKLKDQGLNVFLLSGDSLSPVLQTALQLGIASENAYASSTPEQKAQRVSIQPHSLMVGDGANDAIALAAAHASVAVRGGMEIGLRAASAYSSRPGILPIVTLIGVAQETMRIIRRNLVFAVLYNIVGITIALSGRLNPLFAAILMPMSALTVFVSTIIGTSRLRREFS